MKLIRDDIRPYNSHTCHNNLTMQFMQLLKSQKNHCTLKKRQRPMVSKINQNEFNQCFRTFINNLNAKKKLVFYIYLIQ